MIPSLNDGSRRPPRIAVYGNEWGLLELPRGAATPWTFDECLDQLAAAGFDGCQAHAGKGDQVRAHGLRFAASGRANTPADVARVVAPAADDGAEAFTIHLGWGMETDAEIDALVEAVLAAGQRHRMPVLPETHRATAFQDIWRTCRTLERFPTLRLNGDFSHYYCGQEMGYRGFATSRDYLRPILGRTAFIHMRVSDGNRMQCDLTDPKLSPHLENFRWLWREVFTRWKTAARPGDLLPFTPELGPPSSGYSLTLPGPDGTRIEPADRWRDTLALKALAESLQREG